MKKTVIVLLLVFLTLSCATAAEPPLAQLDESERLFTRAYGHFLQRDYWNAIDYLDRALKANTYLVDYYLLKGLAMNRGGDYGSAQSALAYYREVRPLDPSAARIFAWFTEQQRTLQALLGRTSLTARWQVAYPDLQNTLDSGLLRPFSIKGMGKVRALGDALTLSDTLGDQVYFRSTAGESFRSFGVSSPAVVLPRGDEVFHIFSTSGDVFSFADLAPASPVSLDLKGTIQATVSDACWVCQDEFVVADPVDRTLKFYFAEDLSAPLGTWAPSAQPMLFEPVGLAPYGEWLAIADRGNEMVHFLSLVNRRDFFSLPVSAPRDVAWSSLGELFIVSEKGQILRSAIDFERREVKELSVLSSDFENAWTLFASPKGLMFCLDISGSRLCKATMLPDNDINFGFLSLANPSVALDKNKESFLLEATLSTPFIAYLNKTFPVVYAAWNNRTISSLAMRPKAPAKSDIFVFHRPTREGTVHPSLKSASVETGRDVRIVFPPVWTLHNKTLTHTIIDSTVLLTEEDLNILTRFCLANGLELDIWARDLPPIELLRASALTGGRTLFSLTNVPDLTPPSNRLQIQVPLPEELSSSGYPGRSMMAVFLDVGLMQTRDWLPLWPDLLTP